MMKLKFLSSLRKAACSAAFLIFTFMMSELSNAASGATVTPDFAFPEKVEKDASSLLQKSLAEGDDVQALRAVVQIIVARNQVSSGAFQKNVTLLDSISGCLNQPYSSLATLLEATLYNQLYLSNRWQFRQRVLPLDSFPDDPLAWSEGLFARKVLSLVTKATEDSSSAMAMPISKIEPLLENYEYAVKTNMTVYDFMVYTGANLLETYGSSLSSTVIPFFKDAAPVPMTAGEECADERAKLINTLYDWRIKETNLPALISVVRLKANNLNQTERAEFLKEWMKKLADSPDSGVLLHDYYNNVYPDIQNNVESCKELYSQLNNWIARFPQSDFAAVIKHDIAQLSQKSASVTLPNIATTSQKIKGKLKADNINTVYLLIYSVPESIVPMNSLSVKEFPAKAKFLKAVKMDAKGTVPFSDEQEFELPEFSQGYYVVIPSSKPTLSSNWKNEVERWSISVINVSDISIVSSYSPQQKNSGKLYVVDAATQRPVQGAKVSFYSDRNLKKAVKTGITDDSGSIESPEGFLRARASKGKNVMWWQSDVYYNENKERVNYNAKVLTDLSIYKPGDDVGFAVIAWSSEGHDNRLLAAIEIQALLRDANWQVVDTLNIKTDAAGRCSGNFKLPASGLLGSYSISVCLPSDKKREFGSQHFQVAEYKSPTFFVTVDADKEGVYKAGDTVKFTGEVKTYSGMALTASQVNFTVDWNQWWRWWVGGIDHATYGGSVAVDSEGKFTIELPTANLKGTPFERGIYSLTVTATSPNGETQTSPALRFALGSGFSIRPSLPQNLKVTGDSVRFNVPVYDLLDHPVKELVKYTVVDKADGRTIASGNFESPILQLQSSSLPSAQYELSFKLASGAAVESDSITEEVVIWRENDVRPPFATPLWVPEDKIIAASDAESVNVSVGSGYTDSWVLCLISDENDIIERKWLQIDGKNMYVTVQSPKSDSRRWVNFVGMHDHKARHATVSIIPEVATRKMDVKTLSFRDKISAGDKEKWTFSFKVADEVQTNIPAMAVMSNKALNAISPFKWSFSLGQATWYDRTRVMFMNPQIRTTQAGFSVMPKYKLPNLSLPDWQTYNYQLCGGYGGLKIRGLRKLAMSRSAGADFAEEPEPEVFMSSVENQMSTSAEAPAMATMAMADNAAVKEEAQDAVAEEGEEKLAADTGGSSSQREELRPVEMPLAFFMPSLTADREGNVDVEFVTPNFNTTWQFQIMAYNDDLLSAGTFLEAIASKPVMVQVNAPRYLRTGDQAVVTAMLFNNSPEEQMLHGEIVIFDPVSGETITSHHLGATPTAPGANRVISIDFTVNTTFTALGIRAYAYAGNHSDGEQTLIPVLPSATPVVESTQFYLGTGTQTFSQKLPKFRKDANVTLKYCNNPVWECVLALPAISTPDSENILSLSRAFYANGMAKGIMDRFPAVRSGLDKIFEAKRKGESEMLKSNLQKDSLLKTVALANTPWVNNAASETLRMENLSELLDSKRLTDAISSLRDKLTSLQNSDGGWSWCEGMRSSEFITSSVLSNLAALKRYGVTPDMKLVISKAVAYCDKELYDSYIKSDKKFSTVTMLRYLYVRGILDLGNGKGGFASLKKEALKAIDSEWKDFSVYDKATAAILLNSSPGYEKTARVILESLRQLASKNATKGWWYDNLAGGWNGMPKLTTTARVLEAFAQIEPTSEAVDGLRQWLVLQKETENWGANSSTVGVISAILNSGTDWTVSSEAPVVKLDGKAIDLVNAEMLTGIATVELDPKQTSGKTLSIQKSAAGPAWGGVISQYIAPMAEVKAEKCENLKIEKQLLLVTEDAGGTSAERINLTKGSLKVGDKIRVTLTLTCDKDMDYVAVIDERSACLEPVDQISSYSYADGLGAYREVRDTKTSFFIGYLPKGVNVISYDCYVDREGTYALGIASAQSQYSPLQAAHSAGGEVKVSSSATGK